MSRVCSDESVLMLHRWAVIISKFCICNSLIAHSSFYLLHWLLEKSLQPHQSLATCLWSTLECHLGGKRKGHFWLESCWEKLPRKSTRCKHNYISRDNKLTLVQWDSLKTSKNNCSELQVWVQNTMSIPWGPASLLLFPNQNSACLTHSLTSQHIRSTHTTSWPTLCIPISTLLTYAFTIGGLKHLNLFEINTLLSFTKYQL